MCVGIFQTLGSVISDVCDLRRNSIFYHRKHILSSLGECSSEHTATSQRARMEKFMLRDFFTSVSIRKRIKQDGLKISRDGWCYLSEKLSGLKNPNKYIKFRSRNK